MTDSPGSARTWAVRLAILASIALSGTAAVGAILARLESMSAPVPSVHGVRLGATPDEVRTRRGTDGEWTTRLEPSGDLVLERPGEIYEFHQGMLVAVRAELASADPDAIGPPRQITATSVLVREPAGAAAVRIRLLARDCPTHADEASSLVGARSP